MELGVPLKKAWTSLDSCLYAVDLPERRTRPALGGAHRGEDTEPTESLHDDLILALVGICSGELPSRRT